MATVGLALGSGAAKGLAHIGVLQALEEAHVPVHVIAGSSIGSLVGALYASGMKPSFMEGIACSLKRRHLIDFTVPKMGMLLGEKIRNMVALLTKNGCIEDVQMPLAIVATELLTRELVTFRHGRIADAVRASISIPGVFVPFVTPEGIYVDGGVLNRVPVDAAFNLGASVVIGVDVSSARGGTPPDSMIDVIMQSLDLMQDHTLSTGYLSASTLVVPDVSTIGPSQFSKAKQAIDAGYEATKQAMPQIMQCVFGEQMSDMT